MEQYNFRRIQVSGLNLIAFLGMITHSLMFAMETPLKIAMGIDLSGEVNELLSVLGSLEAMQWMFLCSSIILLIPVFIPIVFNGKLSRWITLVLTALMALMNIADGMAHILSRGEIPQGLASVVISGINGIFASVYAFKWIREFFTQSESGH